MSLPYCESGNFRSVIQCDVFSVVQVWWRGIFRYKARFQGARFQGQNPIVSAGEMEHGAYCTVFYVYSTSSTSR